MNKTSGKQIMRGFGRSNDHRGNVNSASTSSTPVPQLSATQPQGRNFSNQCFYSRGRNKNSKVKGSKASTSGCFSRDLILLSGPNERHVPRQGSKVTLQENGHIISAFNFRKEWSEADVKLEIKNAFQGTLPDDVDFEILFSIQTKLSIPNLAPGQYLTGAVLCRVFKDKKPVYILPSRELLDNTMLKEKGELNDSSYDSNENTQSSSQPMEEDFETDQGLGRDCYQLEPLFPDLTCFGNPLDYQFPADTSSGFEEENNDSLDSLEQVNNIEEMRPCSGLLKGFQSSSCGSENMEVNANLNEDADELLQSIKKGGSIPPDLYPLPADTSSGFAEGNSDSADGLEQAGPNSLNYIDEMRPCSGLLKGIQSSSRGSETMEVNTNVNEDADEPEKGTSNPPEIRQCPAGTSSGFEVKNSDSADGLEQAGPKLVNYIKEMWPCSGPLKSKGGFIMPLVYQNDLPRDINIPVKVTFGDCGIVDAVFENNVMIRGNRIPESSEPKTVRVVLTENGQYYGETEYTYQDEDKLLVEKVKTCPSNVASECLIALADRVKNSPFTGTQDILPYEDNDIKHSSQVIWSRCFHYAEDLDGFKRLCLKSLGKVPNDAMDGYLQLELDHFKLLCLKSLGDVVNDFQQFLEKILHAGRVSFTRYKHQLVHVAYGRVELEEYMNCVHQRLQQLLCSENDETTDLVLVIEAVLKLIGHRNKAIDSSTAKPCVEESIDEESECDDDSGYCADDEADEEVSSFAFAVRDSPGGRHRHKSLQDNRVKKQKVGKENGSGRTNSTSTEMDCQMDDEDGSNEDFMEVIYTLRNNITVIPEGKLNVRNEEGMPDVNKIMQYGYQELYSVIQWAKAVPGFMELGVEDQVALLKAGFMDLNVFRLAYRSVACDPNSVLFAKDIICDRSTCIEMGWTPDLVDTTLEFTEKLRNLNLDQCEFACLSTLVLLSPDTPDLRNKVRVTELQSKISRCLKEYEDKIHPAKANRYSKLLLGLATLRSDGEKALENYITLEFFGKLVAELLD